MKAFWNWEINTSVLATLPRETSHAKALRRKAAKEEEAIGESTPEG
jgi:hypothetical protein